MMKSIQFSRPGSPSDVLSCVERARPEPARGQVLVRLLAAPINPSDLMFVRGKYTVPSSVPGYPGFEGVGVVEKSGGDWRGRFLTGRRVVVLNRRGGNWAEYATVRSDEVIPVSRSLTDEQAATFFVNPATSWIITRDVLRVPRGAWLVQTAAASSLGQMTIRLAENQGIRTLNIVRRGEQAELLKRSGAAHVVVFDGTRDSPDVLRAAVDATMGGQGIRYAMDAVGGETGSAVAQCLGEGGHLVAFGALSGSPLQISPRSLMTTGGRIEGFWLGHYLSRASLVFKLRLVRRLTRLIQTGILETRIRGVFSLDDVIPAVAAAETNPDGGKILLRMRSNCGHPATELTSAVPAARRGNG